MAARELPNLGLKAFWGLGYDGWDAENDLNLLKLSVLVQGTVDSVEASEPGGGSNGDTHLLESGDIIVRDADAWVHIAPQAGWRMWNNATASYWAFDGSQWEEQTDSDPTTDLVELRHRSPTTVLEIVDSTPADPPPEAVYATSGAHPTDPLSIAVWVDEQWVYYPTELGWILYDLGTTGFYSRTPTSWGSLFGEGGDGIEEAPSTGGPYARKNGAWVDIYEEEGGNTDTVYPEARQWRVRTVTAGAGAECGWSTISFRDAGDISLADDDPANGVAIFSSEQIGYEAIGAFDSLTGTRWLADSESVGSWIGWNFDEAVQVAKVVLFPHPDNLDYTPTEWAIEYYDDDTSGWVEVATGSHTWTISEQVETAIDGEEVPADNPNGGISDAPEDGNTYGRKDGAWNAVVPAEKLVVLADQAAYDALDPVDPDTFYFIPEAV